MPDGPGGDGETTPEHLIALGGDWALWRWACLRGTGFPASLVLRLGSAQLAIVVDDVLEAERILDKARYRLQGLRLQRSRARRGVIEGAGDREAAVEAQSHAVESAVGQLAKLRDAAARRFDADLVAMGKVLREVASEARFREAVTWQNRGAVESAIDGVAHNDPSLSGARARDRARQNLVASYLHRYCVKNDTIGFFGPIGWATLETAGDAVAVKAGPTLLASRKVYFEQWPIDALARAMADNARWRPWLVPRRYGFIQLQGKVVHSALSGKVALSEPEAIVLGACDAVRTAKDVAEHVTMDPASVYEILEALRAKKMVSWELECPTTWEPNRTLRSALERVGDPTLRAEGLASLDALEAARNGVAAAAGDPSALPVALEALDATFARLSGAAPTRNPGATYGARGIVYEECLRDLDLRLGPRIVGELAPALCLVLASARWLTAEVASVYSGAFRDLFRKRARGANRVPLADVWFPAKRLVHGAKDRPLDGIVRELGERWDSVLGLQPGVRRRQFSAEDLRSRVDLTFGGRAPGSPGFLIHHSPDLLLAASSVEALRSGDYYAVLGEIHVGVNTLAQRGFAMHHPRIDDLRVAMQHDWPGVRVKHVINKASPRGGTIGGELALAGPDTYELESGFEPSAVASRVLRLADLYVEEGPTDLVVTGADGGGTIPLLTMMAEPLADAVSSVLSLGSNAAHSPRLSFDHLVVARESWQVVASAMSFARASSDFSVFIEARRWAKALDLPRFVFLRSPLEVKPVFVDFESPISLRIVARLIRNLQEDPSTDPARATVRITEMLPTIEEAWLPDATGQRYCAEIRLVALDRR